MAIKGWTSNDPQNWITKKMLEKIRGKGISYLWAMPKARLYIRQMTRIITRLDNECWGANPKIPLDKKLEDEFKVWLKMDMMLLRHVWRPEMMTLNQPAIVSFTDASSFAWGIVFYDTEGNEHRYTTYIGEDLISAPIHIKEIVAILNMLDENEEFFTERTIIHYCDNISVCHAFRNLGTPNEELNDWVTKIYEKLHKLKSIMR